MADERVNLLVDIDVKGDKSLATLSAKLLAFEKMTERLESRSNRLSGAMNGISGAAGRAGKNQKDFNQQLGLADRLASRLIKSARLVMFAVIGVGIEFAISALSIASVNAAFAVGKFAMQAYNYGMQALAGTVAALGVAAIGAAAAFREFQAAQYQFRYKDSARLGSALDQSSQGLRSLYKDTTLATFGVKTLASAFAAVGKESAFTPASKNALKAMADFARAGADPAQSLQSAATMIGILQKGKGFTQEALAAAKQISPEFDKAFKKGSYKNKDKFLEDLIGGKLAGEAGVSGQADAVGRTLFGQFKTYLNQSLVEISDVGQRVLEPIKEAMHGIFQGLTRAFRRVSGDLVAFGQGPFLKSLDGFTRKLEDFTLVLFRKFLPATEGFWKKTTGFFTGFARYFREVRDALEPLRDGGSIVIKTFGKPILEIFKQIGKSVQALDEMAVKNKGNFLAFGDALAKIVEGFFDISRAIRVAFNSALPLLNPLLKGLAWFMRLIGTITGSGLVGGNTLGSAALLGGMGYFGMKGRRSQRFARRHGGMTAQKMLDKEIYGGGISGSMGDPGSAAAAAFRAPATALTGAGSSLTGAAGALTQAASAIGTRATAATSAAAAARAQPIVPGKGLGRQINKNSRGEYLDPVTGNVITRQIATNDAYFRHINRNVSASTTTAFGPEKPYGPLSLFQRNLQKSGTSLKPSGKGSGSYHNYMAFAAPNTLPALTWGKAGPGARYGNSNKSVFNQTPLSTFVPTPSLVQRIGVQNLQANPAAMNAAAQPQMTRRQRILSYLRAQTGTAIPTSNFPTNTSIDARNARDERDAKSQLTGSQRIQSYFRPILRDTAGNISGAMGGGGRGTQVSGAMGGGVRGRLKGLLGKALLGQSYGTQGYEGFGKTVRTQLGFAKGGAGNNMFTRIMTGAKGGNFGKGYSDAQFKAGERGEKFSRLKGIKAGMRNSIAGGGIVMGLATGALINSSIGQKYMKDEDAKSSMMTGAGLMAINPLLGLAVGAGLTAFKAKTKMGGALAGAVSGAAIGGMVAGPLGVVVGGLIGTGLGMFAADRNQTKMVKAAMGRINYQQLATVAQTALSEIKTGKMDKTQKVLADSSGLSARFEAAKTDAEMKKVLQPYIDAGMIDGNALSLATGGKKKEAVAEIKGLEGTMQKAVTPQLIQFVEIMKALKQSTGMASDAIFDLAMRKNVDLYDVTLDLASATAKLGVGMTKTAANFRNALRDVQIGALDVFTQFKKTREMKDALQSSGETWRGGDNSTDAVLDYYTKSQDLANYLNPNSPLQNFLANAQGFGIGTNVGKGKLFSTSGPLKGQTMGAEAKGLIHDAQEQTAAGTASVMSTQLGSMLSGAGVTFSDVDIGTKNMETQIKALITSAAGGDMEASLKVLELEKDITRGTALKGKSQAEIAAYFSGIFGPGIASGAGSRFKGQGTSLFGQRLETETAGKIGIEITDEAKTKMQEAFSAAIKAGWTSTAPDWWDKDVPEWWQKGLTAEIDEKGGLVRLLPPPDTATPKAGQFGDTSTSKNLRRTLGRHSSFDGMLTGKREITSSLRDYNLGSPSSDHATGNAYDLVGQNLGQYSSLIKSASGFAEFHGAAGSRHLHVVPPPGPMGDTSTSMLASMTGGGGTDTYEGDTFNINVSGAGDPQTTARAVAQEIMKMQKNIKQRS